MARGAETCGRAGLSRKETILQHLCFHGRDGYSLGEKMGNMFFSRYMSEMEGEAGFKFT